MSRTARRYVIAASALLAAALVAGCGSMVGATETTSPAPPATPTGAGGTLVPTGTATPSTPALEPDQGNVGGVYPELAVEPADGYLVSVTDPAAKAWRIDVRAAGADPLNRLELLVEVGDIAPGAEARIYVDGRLADVIDMTGMIGLETASAGGCHPTLAVCVGSESIAIDPGSGRVSALIQVLDGRRIEIQGATADWPEEPFVLGPWRTTEPFASF